MSKLLGVDSYDFIKNAPQARWMRDVEGKLLLPFGGEESDRRGFVRYLEKVILEDGQTYAQGLMTHPEWKNRGIIRGIYEGIRIPPKAKFIAKVGFKQGADKTDGVTFKLIVISNSVGPAIVVATKPIFYDAHLDNIDVSLEQFANQTVTIIIQVEAGPSSGQDWVVWTQASLLEELPMPQITPETSAKVKASLQKKKIAETTPIPQFKPIFIKKIPLIPVGVTPPKYQIQEYKTLAVDEPISLSKVIYKNLTKANTFYFLPLEINLAREESTGNYRISAVWTQQQKIRTTLTLKAKIDPFEVKLLEEKLKATEGPSAALECLPYEEASIIDMKGWEDWDIEDIRLPTFGSLEGEMPINIAMSPETLAQLKPLLEKEGLTAAMSIKTGEKERAIPIRIGLKYFTGRIYSSIEEISYAYDEPNSILTVYNVTNHTDFPIEVKAVNLRFKIGSSEELYKNLRCQPATIIPPKEKRNIKVRFSFKDGLLLAEYRKLFPSLPSSSKPKTSIIKKVTDLIKEEIEKKAEKQKEVAEKFEEAPDPRQDNFFKNYLRSYWLEFVPDFDCQSCLDRIWDKIEVVSYIERMRRINVEILSSVFDSQAFDPPIEVEKVHVDLRSPYLSAKGKETLLTSVDFNKEKLKELVVAYLPLSSEEEFYFEYKVKAILKTGESFESSDWERISESLDLTIGPFQIKKIIQK
ncbi:MAG: hypothetical protein N3B16_07715 [Candidatus Aminicenantes bacterium]|nr:hypothetical protein [Candidatus Aminicenantes bacterium]